MLSRLIAAAVASVALASPSFASEPCYHYERVITYETVLTWEIRREAYQVNCTLFDACGRPYIIAQTAYRDVRVQIKKIVPVTKIVKVSTYSAVRG